MPRLLPVPRKGERADRPGRVTQIKGVIFQSDGKSTIGRAFIRPFEALDRLVAGALPPGDERTLAMHAGLHLVIDGQREYVAEQLVGTLYMDFTSGLNWTPLADFRRRDRGGWDATVPATSFRGVDDQAVEQAMANLNRIHGHPFVGEDCTAFIERAFGGRRMFADSPLLRVLGVGARVGDPALPLLKPDVELDPRTRHLLNVDAICRLPDALANPMALNIRNILARAALGAGLGALLGLLLHRLTRR
jgi:hypothetical protein